MNEPNILFNLIALYLLNTAEIPLSAASLCEFFVNGNYTDYFTAKGIVTDLNAGGLIDSKQNGTTTFYSINERGTNTLTPMMDRIGTDIKNEVESFLRLNDISFREKTNITASYDKATFGGYILHLKAMEEDVPVLDLSLHISDLEQAKSICSNWKNNYEEAYAAILESLL